MAPKIKNEAPLFQLLNKKPEVAKSKSSGSSLPKLFPKNPEHRLGTCWKCGAENEIPGGDLFKCSKDGWLRWKPQMSLQAYMELQAQVQESGGELPDLGELSDGFDDADDLVDNSVAVVELPESVDNCAANEQAIFDMEDDYIEF